MAVRTLHLPPEADAARRLGWKPSPGKLAWHRFVGDPHWTGVVVGLQVEAARFNAQWGESHYLWAVEGEHEPFIYGRTSGLTSPRSVVYDGDERILAHLERLTACP